MSAADSRGIPKEILYGAAAVLIFALLWRGTFRDRREDCERTTAEIVVLGDSLLGQPRDETSVTACLSELLGTRVYNGAMGGTCMTSAGGIPSGSYGLELMNMVNLSRAIVSGDFGAQRTVRSRQPASEYFEENIYQLARMDFRSVETLILEFGLNDYHNAVPIENAEDPTDERTFAGAIRSVVSLLRKNYPDMRIVMVTPTYGWYIERRLTCEEYDTGNGYLEKYVDALIRTAGETGVEVIDLYHDVYDHDEWEDWMRYTKDGVHPNETGRQIIAECIAEGL